YKKVSSDINRVELVTDSADTNDDGSTKIILGDTSKEHGLAHKHAPRGQNTWIQLNVGGVSMTSSSGGGGGGAAAVILTHTRAAAYAPTIAAPTADGQFFSWKLTQNGTGGFGVDWTNGGTNPVAAETFPKIDATVAGTTTANSYSHGLAQSFGGNWYNIFSE